MIAEIPGKSGGVPVDGSVQLALLETRLSDLHLERRRTKRAIGERDDLLHDNMVVSFSVEVDSPQFTNGRFRMLLGTEEGVANPKRQWATGVIGPLEETLVMPALLGTIAGVVDMWEELGKGSTHTTSNRAAIYGPHNVKARERATRGDAKGDFIRHGTAHQPGCDQIIPKAAR
jgi:hypothetical protein